MFCLILIIFHKVWYLKKDYFSVKKKKKVFDKLNLDDEVVLNDL